MEVCGTHTMAIYHHGILEMVPSKIHMLSGPGCPVCVTPNRYIDHAIALSREPKTIITTFGDMIKVPGSTSSLEQERAKGGKIQVVFSALDSLAIAESRPEQRVVFLGIGFETTAPSVASVILEAEKRKIYNHFVLCGHKLIPPAMEALCQGEVCIHGYLCPAHVTTIIGSNVYTFIPEKYKIPCVVAGFEPLDILLGILMLLKQVISKTPHVQNQYLRVATKEGNLEAQKIMYTVFEPCSSEWRGIGTIPNSGLRIQEKYARFDAAQMLKVEIEPTKENPNCICGQILKGMATPFDCSLFGKICTPTTPHGACMVSSEGTCAAFYKYKRNLSS
jgi:hydrogenase expression/formation protein HypD